MSIEAMIAAAPPLLKERLVNHHVSVKRLQRAQKQVGLWQQELGFAKEMFRATEHDYQNVLNRWDSETNTIRPDEKLEMNDVEQVPVGGSCLPGMGNGDI